MKNQLIQVFLSYSTLLILCFQVKDMLYEIINRQKKLRNAMQGNMPEDENSVRILIKVPNNMVGLVIGRGGETIKYIAEVNFFENLDEKIDSNLENWSSCVHA